MPTWLPATVTARTDANPALFTLTLDLHLPFVAGQFVSLTLDPDGTRHTRRAYSIASPPGEPLHFLFVEVEGGKVSPDLRGLRLGDRVYVASRAKGRFTPERVPSSTRNLWLFATGTGIAPYRSMLLSPAALPSVERIFVPYGVRHVDRLVYANELSADPRVRVLPMISRGPPGAHLRGRADERLRDDSLEQAAGQRIDTPDTHVMLCGNPDMITSVRGVLTARGLRTEAITIERYW